MAAGLERKGWLLSSRGADCSAGCSTRVHLSSVQEVQCQHPAFTAKTWFVNTQKDPYCCALNRLKGKLLL